MKRAKRRIVPSELHFLETKTIKGHTFRLALGLSHQSISTQTSKAIVFEKLYQIVNESQPISMMKSSQN